LTPSRKTESRESAQNSQHYALSHELPKEPNAARAKRKAGSNLMLTACGAGKQKARQIHAREQKRHCHYTH
jgi:hypothetical protein